MSDGHVAPELSETLPCGVGGHRRAAAAVLEDRVHRVSAEECRPCLPERVTVPEEVDGDDLTAEPHHRSIRLDRREVRHHGLHAVPMAIALVGAAVRPRAR